MRVDAAHCEPAPVEVHDGWQRLVVTGDENAHRDVARWTGDVLVPHGADDGRELRFRDQRRRGLWAPVQEAARRGVPLLGVCVGMYGLLSGTSASWMGLPMLRRFREGMAQVSPMDPKSPIDFSGLAIIFSISSRDFQKRRNASSKTA